MRNSNDTLLKLLLEQKKPRWNINFCPNCGSYLVEQRIIYSFDRESGELCALSSSVDCRSCRSSIPLSLFCIEDIESNESGEGEPLNVSLMEFKRQVTSYLPDNWQDKEAFRNSVKRFMQQK